MALIKAIEIQDTGILPTYWRIAQTTYNTPSNEENTVIEVCLCGYVDKAARDAGKHHVGDSEQRVLIRGDDLAGIITNTVDQVADAMYNFLKTETHIVDGVTTYGIFYGASDDV